MTTTTHTRARPERVDRDMSQYKNGEHVGRWHITDYPYRGLHVETEFFYGVDRVTIASAHSFVGRLRAYGPMVIAWIDRYDPARVTVGGLAEAHEAVCARVERGELP